MSQSTTQPGVLTAPRMRPGGFRHSAFLRFLRTKPLGAAGLFLIVFMVVVALLAPVIAPHDPYKINVAKAFTPPGDPVYWLGTDELGRDLLTRLIWGSRISMWVGILAVVFGQTTGMMLGMVSGYFGGKIDLTIQRLTDILQSFPGLVFALAVVAALGSSITNVMLAIALVIAPSSARVIRSTVLSIKQRQYIEAARGVGASNTRILFSHILPNIMAPYLILASAGLGGAILTEASLSFLGVGTPPPEPSWGLMLSGAARQYLEKAPWMSLFPGVAISLAVFGFNLLGDALRDVWDPRLRGR